eukprot:CAMPEP_0183748728 /NCGR_PEP_ID=MMETSP0737-20130205/67922_1 /TAXON_ID=385413 /ORGANISM="Thalassiosira miniscula, Strain CCMP1093" /LENGTH=439 /DNA_ID=CAMNT_0025984467 /DNA_START=456 /DNA_END=1775 /DNA_ORIENTATION=+
MAKSASDKPLQLESASTLTFTKNFVAHFTKRDLLLYALGIGCCDESCNDKEKFDRELRFVYEHHPNFEPFPTFLLALSFSAQHLSEEKGATPTASGIRSFPPDTLTNYRNDGSHCGILPKEFFKNQEEDMDGVESLPILHMSQSLILHDNIKFNTTSDQATIDPPTQMQIETSILSVKPRGIGTFVTSETRYYQDGSYIATSQMVALILGLDPDAVVSLDRGTHKNVEGQKKMTQSTPVASFKGSTQASASEKKSKEKTVLHYQIPRNAALLYRLSGDYNRIHVEDNLLSLGNDEQDGKDGKPGYETKERGALLHGLCTMGYAVRAVLHHANNHPMKKSRGGEVNLKSVQCNFVNPVYVGDSLCVDVWDDADSASCCSSGKGSFDVFFRVYRNAVDAASAEQHIHSKQFLEVVVEKGRAQFCICNEGLGTEMATHVSRL